MRCSADRLFVAEERSRIVWPIFDQVARVRGAGVTKTDVFTNGITPASVRHRLTAASQVASDCKETSVAAAGSTSVPGDAASSPAAAKCFCSVKV